MSHVDFCLIADHNSDRRNGLKEKIASYKLSSTVVQAINCGHGLLYLTQCSDKVIGKQVVVILNSKTPIMGGIEFLRELKKCEVQYNADTLKIVVLEDGLSDEDKKEYETYGVVDFMDCNLEDDELELQLKNIFKKPRTKSAEDSITKMRKIANTSEESARDLESKQVYMIPNSNVG